MLMEDSQWSATDHLESVLKPYQLATTVVSGHKYVTMSLMLPIVTKLAADMKVQSQTVDSVLRKSFASSLYKAMVSKFNLSTIKPSAVAVVASALDPRFRDLQFLEQDQRQHTQETLQTKSRNSLLCSVQKNKSPWTLTS